MILILLTGFILHAQQSMLKFNQLTQSDGLSNDFVLSISQDHKGFIWIGTDNGLNRYDGYRMTIFKDDPEVEGSLQGNFVLSIFEDSNQNIWVGTEKGINLLVPETASFEFIQLLSDTIEWNNNSAINNLDINSIDEDRQGNIWLATAMGLICLKNGKHEADWKVQHFPLPSQKENIDFDNKIFGVEVDKKGNLWVATESGVHRIQPENEKVETLVLDSTISIKSGYDQRDVLHMDEQGKIILITRDNGLCRIEQPESIPLVNSYSNYLYDPEDIFSFSKKGIKDVWPFKEDDIWVGTDQGLYQVNLTKGDTVSYLHDPFVKGSISFNRIRKLYRDKNEVLWVGTYGGGINFSENISLPFHNYVHQPNDLNSISKHPIRSILMDDADFLWVATLGGGLDKMKYRPNKGWSKILNLRHDPTDPNSLPSNDLLHIIQTHEGKILIASAGLGLTELDPVSGVTKTYLESEHNDFDYDGIWSLCEDQRGNIWMGTRWQGVFRLNTKTGKVTKFFENSHQAQKFEDNFIFNIYEDRNGHIWFCTTEGLFRYNTDTEDLKGFLHDSNLPQSISNSTTWTIMEDHKGFLWVGTNQGLNRFDRETEKFDRFYEKDGLPSNVVYGLLEDDKKRLWISTDAGLALLNLSLKNTTSNNRVKPFRSFDQKTLSGGSFLPHAYFKDERKGRLFFGGLHGLNEIYPEQVVANISQPPLLLSSFTVQNQTKEIGHLQIDPFISNKERIELTYQDDVITFTFTDLNFKKSSENKFKYQLLGLSDQWIPLTDNKTMTFIDLAAGTYTLNMQGTNADGIPIKTQTLLEIKILPPWWNSFWAYIVYGFLLFGLIYFIRQFEFNQRLLRQEAMVERAHAEEKQRQAETVEIQAKKLEQSLGELQSKNEEIIKAQEQLIWQEKMASLGQLTAGIAHEIKNPLNFITNFAEGSVELTKELDELIMANKNILPTGQIQQVREIVEDIKMNADDIREQGKRADRIVRSMMDHARGSQGERRTIDLNQLVTDNINLAYHGYRALDPSFNVHIEKVLEKTLPPVEVYPQELGRVLLNLLNNACYAVNQKQKSILAQKNAGLSEMVNSVNKENYKPTIEVRTRSEKNYVLIIIRDNGPGIPVEVQEKIFTPFFTTKKSGEGNTGLGLSISYEIIVQQHNGIMEVESNSNEFTAFSIRLPVSAI